MISEDIRNASRNFSKTTGRLKYYSNLALAIRYILYCFAYFVTCPERDQANIAQAIAFLLTIEPQPV